MDTATGSASIVGQTEAEFFWSIGGEIRRAPRDQEVVDGRPTFARWECSAVAFEAHRETVFGWVEAVTA